MAGPSKEKPPPYRSLYGGSRPTTTEDSFTPSLHREARRQKKEEEAAAEQQQQQQQGQLPTGTPGSALATRQQQFPAPRPSFPLNPTATDFTPGQLHQGARQAASSQYHGQENFPLGSSLAPPPRQQQPGLSYRQYGDTPAQVQQQLPYQQQSSHTQSHYGLPPVQRQTGFGSTHPTSQRSQLSTGYTMSAGPTTSGTLPQQPCYKCGQFGHIQKDCPEEDTCFYCYQPGHVVADCPERKATTQCYRCSKMGHIAKNCPERRKGPPPSGSGFGV